MEGRLAIGCSLHIATSSIYQLTYCRYPSETVASSFFSDCLPFRQIGVSKIPYQLKLESYFNVKD